VKNLLFVRFVIFFTAMMFAVTAQAATTTIWELNGYQDFLRGRLSGVSLTRDGRLTPGPALVPIFSSDQPEIWAVASAPDGSLYLGTGHRGRLIKVDASGNGSVIWTADQPEIFAVTVDRAGVVYAGTSPDGKVYRLENGKATEYFSPHEPYIWSLAFAPDGSLYVGTGQQGEIFRVTAAGRGGLYYETGQSHITALAFDREGRLLAGSEPNGILYRLTGNPGKAFVLYQSHLPEIRSILTASDGTVYASALGGSVARRVGAASSAANTSGVTVTASATSITVTADAQAAMVIPPKPEAPKPASTPATVSAVTTASENTGVEKSALYRISPDNTVETLWSSKDENIYDVAAEASGTLLLLTDAQGRIYRLDARRPTSAGSGPGAGSSTGNGQDAALVAQANESDATRIITSPRGVFASLGSAAKLVRLDTAAASGGWFESPVHDAGAVARWGRISWANASGANQPAVAFRTRTGNSARPDSTWSDWSAPLPAPSAIASPNARFIQWRAEFTGAPAEIASVRLAYLPQNAPPILRSVTVNSTTNSTTKTPQSTSASTAYSITVTDTGDSSTPAGTQAQTLGRPSGQQTQVVWQADDPDGDKLSYSLYFRGEDERDWKLLRANVSENTFPLDADALADGRYYFRVVATDRPSNAADQARETELVSAPVVIDNTPPAVTAGAPQRAGTAVEINVDAEDRGSDLRRCEFSLDAQPWLPVEAADGLTDSPREHFLVRIDNFPAGEHVVVVRVYDAAGNAGLAKIIVR
jgi:WD40 repeat protein